MRRLPRFLPIVGLIGFGLGCGGTPPMAPEPVPEDASRVFALAEDLEKNQKTKQAMDAYQQVVRLFPKTPEAKKAAERISQAQRDAMRKAAARKRK